MKRKITSLAMLMMVVVPLLAANAKGKAAVDGVLNLNTASAEELSMLPGIGRSKAEAIVAFRTAHPFKATSELVEVKGIGQKMYEKLQAYLTVDGPSTLKQIGSSPVALQAPAAPVAAQK